MGRGHLLPSEAAATAREAGAKRLLLTHIPVADGGAWALAEARAGFEGSVEIAEPMRSDEV